jgi:hypothetical protein
MLRTLLACFVITASSLAIAKAQDGECKQFTPMFEHAALNAAIMQMELSKELVRMFVDGFDVIAEEAIDADQVARVVIGRPTEFDKDSDAIQVAFVDANDCMIDSGKLSLGGLNAIFHYFRIA